MSRHRSLDGIEDPQSDINMWLAAGDMRLAAWQRERDSGTPSEVVLVVVEVVVAVPRSRPAGW